MTAISAQDAAGLVHSGAEIAFLDVREAGQFGEGHPLFAVPAPYSQLEFIIPLLVPRRDVPVVLIDAGDGVAARAAIRLTEAGYGDVRWIDGGTVGWAAAGLTLYQGVNVPSKTLGELAEHVWHPPMIQPGTLADWNRDQRPYLLYDARPPAEYAKMRVPHAVCLPNGELAHRIATQPTGTGPLVITCAGRTRGIIGVIGLQLAGHDGEVFALENGTQGWALQGEVLERGNTAQAYPEPDAAALAKSALAADRIMARFGIPAVTAAELPALRAEAGRTTYLFDTRSAPEAKADPVPGAVHAPGGQLVQATDQWVGVRHARLVLCCDTGLRSALAAFWLRQLGFDARVLRIDDAVRAMQVPAKVTHAAPDLATVHPETALAMMRAGKALLLDLRGSMAYRQGHVAGARWVIRPRLGGVLARAQAAAQVLLLADDPRIAALVAQDLKQAGATRVALIAGGHAAMLAAGAASQATVALPADEDALDHLFFVHDRHDGNLDASRRYLAWETGLIGQLSTAERAEFRLFHP